MKISIFQYVIYSILGVFILFLFFRCSITIDRNYVLIEEMKKIVHGEKEVEKGKKPIKPQDLVRLYDTVIQNYNEMPQLAGLEDDLELKQEMEAKVVCCKAHKYVFDIWFSENIITLHSFF